MITFLVLAACTGRAPELISVNGEAVPRNDPLIEVQGEVGERVAIELELRGRDETRVWSVGAPPGWVVDPDLAQGDWLVEANATTAFTLLLDDSHDLAAYPVFLGVIEP